METVTPASWVPAPIVRAFEKYRDEGSAEMRRRVGRLVSDERLIRVYNRIGPLLFSLELQLGHTFMSACDDAAWAAINAAGMRERRLRRPAQLRAIQRLAKELAQKLREYEATTREAGLGVTEGLVRVPELVDDAAPDNGALLDLPAAAAALPTLLEALASIAEREQAAPPQEVNPLVEAVLGWRKLGKESLLLKTLWLRHFARSLTASIKRDDLLSELQLSHAEIAAIGAVALGAPAQIPGYTEQEVADQRTEAVRGALRSAAAPKTHSADSSVKRTANRRLRPTGCVSSIKAYTNQVVAKKAKKEQ